MPKIIDREQYRKELLMESFYMFAQKGYASLTMRQLARCLGVSTGKLYHYFPSKEDLFLQLVEQQTQQDILKFLAETENSPIMAERIKSLFNFFAANEDYFCKQSLLWVNFYQQQERDEILKNETLKVAVDKVKQVVADYLQIKDKAVINLIFNLLNGLIYVRIFERETISFAEQSVLLSEILTAYLELKQPVNEFRDVTCNVSTSTTYKSFKGKI